MSFTNADLRKISQDYRTKYTIKEAENIKKQIMDTANSGYNRLCSQYIPRFCVDIIKELKKDFPEIIVKKQTGIGKNNLVTYDFSWEIEIEPPKPTIGVVPPTSDGFGGTLTK